ncbi:MAG: ribose 5-phosphate isomerase B [Dehalococcoidales bacterium]
MRIAIGNDHHGCNLKTTVIEIVTKLGYTVHDFGCYTDDAVDYPDIAMQVAEGIVKGKYDRGILICGTGIGMCIAANKVRGIRAAQCYDVFTAHRARLHNNAQICCLAAEETETKVRIIVEDFLNTEYEGGRHDIRLKKIKEIEDKQCR